MKAPCRVANAVSECLYSDCVSTCGIFTTFTIPPVRLTKVFNFTARTIIYLALLSRLSISTSSNSTLEIVMSCTTASRFEYVTIVGSTFDEVIAEIRKQKLNEMQFSLLQPIDRHLIKMAQPASGADRIDGRRLITAVFARRICD